MSCGTLIPTSPVPPRAPSISGGCFRRRIPPSGRWRCSPSVIREPHLSSKRSATSTYGGAIGELSETNDSFYELLGIPETCSNDEVKIAYRQLARKYHPDVSPPERAAEYTRRFIKVKEAYDTLSDPGFRALYDRSLAKSFHLTFSIRRQFDEEFDISRRKNCWQDQLATLKRRGTRKNSNENLSWAERVRRRREDPSAA